MQDSIIRMTSLLTRTNPMRISVTRHFTRWQEGYAQYLVSSIGYPSHPARERKMAHHMLYTALMEHDCYDGYLWAPFDALLNVPRLQQFDQDLFWYHSPFGEYVPNVALGDEDVNANKSHHPPPLNISPDPAIDLSQTWRGWGPDWW